MKDDTWASKDFHLLMMNMLTFIMFAIALTRVNVVTTYDTSNNF